VRLCASAFESPSGLCAKCWIITILSGGIPENGVGNASLHPAWTSLAPNMPMDGGLGTTRALEEDEKEDHLFIP